MNEKYMRLAIEKAKMAFQDDEVPVGTVIVEDDIIIATGYNRIEKKHSSLEHSEIIAIKEAQRKKNNWRLNNCILYTTLEPCLMCAGAIVNARIKKVVYATESNYLTKNERQILQKIYEQNNIEIFHGILEQDSKKLLAVFFENKRKKQKNN